MAYDGPNLCQEGWSHLILRVSRSTKIIPSRDIFSEFPYIFSASIVTVSSHVAWLTTTITEKGWLLLDWNWIPHFLRGFLTWFVTRWCALLCEIWRKSILKGRCHVLLETDAKLMKSFLSNKAFVTDLPDFHRRLIRIMSVYIFMYSPDSWSPFLGGLTATIENCIQNAAHSELPVYSGTLTRGAPNLGQEAIESLEPLLGRNGLVAHTISWEEKWSNSLTLVSNRRRYQRQIGIWWPHDRPLIIQHWQGQLLWVSSLHAREGWRLLPYWIAWLVHMMLTSGSNPTVRDTSQSFTRCNEQRCGQHCNLTLQILYSISLTPHWDNWHRGLKFRRQNHRRILNPRQRFPSSCVAVLAWLFSCIEIFTQSFLCRCLLLQSLSG